MSRIQSGRWSELLRRATGQAGIEVVASELSPEISPTWQLEGNTVEWDYLKSTKRLLCAVSIESGGYGAWRLRNPEGSGVVAVIENIDITVYSSNLLFNLQLEEGTSDLAVTGFPIVSDTRWVPPPFNDPSISTLHFTTQTTGAQIITGSLLGYWRIHDADFPFQRLNPPVVLSPGWALTLASDKAGAHNFCGSVTYRERTLPPLER